MTDDLSMQSIYPTYAILSQLILLVQYVLLAMGHRDNKELQQQQQQQLQPVYPT